MLLSPIALFVFKRLEYTKLTIESLKKNSEAPDSDLIIFSDAAKSEKDKQLVEDVREYLNSVTGFKSVTIHKSEKNQGLANSIINGVTKVVNQYGKIIVLEDDMIVSPFFLKYMNEALALYENEEKVASIHGYIYPVEGKLPETFFLKGADCWGWGTWKRGWELFEPDSGKLLNEIKERKLDQEFDFNGAKKNTRMLENQLHGKIDSWAIRWHASAFLADKFTLYPGRSLVKNIGMGKEATHTRSIDVYDVPVAIEPLKVKKIEFKENIHAKKQVEEFHKRITPVFLIRLLQFIKQRL